MRRSNIVETLCKGTIKIISSLNIRFLHPLLIRHRPTLALERISSVHASKLKRSLTKAGEALLKLRGRHASHQTRITALEMHLST